MPDEKGRNRWRDAPLPAKIGGPVGFQSYGRKYPHGDPEADESQFEEESTNYVEECDAYCDALKKLSKP